jgi:replicative DNA helicase
MVEMKDKDPEIFSTGLPSIDRVLGGGIAPGEVAVVGASTSHGKTLFGLQVAYAISAAGHHVLVVSEEMNIKTLADRAILASTDIEQCNWKSRWDEVFDAVCDWEDRQHGNIVIPDVPCHSIQRADFTIAEAVQHYHVKAVVVDYLQLLSGPGQSRYEQVSNVSRSLKQAAVEHSIAVIALAQLNRTVDKEGKGIPQIHHLSESGQIERDADIVLLLQWPHRTDREYQPANEYRVVCGKNRNRGIRGQATIELRIEPMRQRIVEKDVHVDWHDVEEEVQQQLAF